jgi:hypothetical protein
MKTHPENTITDAVFGFKMQSIRVLNVFSRAAPLTAGQNRDRKVSHKVV